MKCGLEMKSNQDDGDRKKNDVEHKYLMKS